jgi:thioredoxin 1
MIAPTFEALATKFAKPNRITFAKVDVDRQQEIAQQYSVRAMPTFKILHNGTVIETIQGANPAALTAAVEKAVKLAGSGGGASFSTPGRTLGGPAAATNRAGAPRQGLSRPMRWDLNSFVNVLITFFGLYFTSLISVSGNFLRSASQLLMRADRPIHVSTELSVQRSQSYSADLIEGCDGGKWAED